MSVLALLADTSCLTATLAQVVQLGATYVAAAHNLDVVDRGCVHREGTLHAYAERHLADLEGLTNAVALTVNDVAVEHLDTGTRTLDDLDVSLHVVTGAEVGNVFADLARANVVKLLHDLLLAHATGPARYLARRLLMMSVRRGESLAPCGRHKRRAHQRSIMPQGCRDSGASLAAAPGCAQSAARAATSRCSRGVR